MRRTVISRTNLLEEMYFAGLWTGFVQTDCTECRFHVQTPPFRCAFWFPERVCTERMCRTVISCTYPLEEMYFAGLWTGFVQTDYTECRFHVQTLPFRCAFWFPERVCTERMCRTVFLCTNPAGREESTADFRAGSAKTFLGQGERAGSRKERSGRTKQ